MIRRMRILAGRGLVATVAGAVALALAGPAFANGGSSTGTRGLGSAKCPSGWTLNPTTKKCVQQSSGLTKELPAIGWEGADPAFVEAAVLAHSGQYEAAIVAFTKLARPDDPYVLNYLGFANRKLGHVDTALGYYGRALSIRPDYVRAREYLGEGYIALGRIDEAKQQLAMIATQCGTDCEEYRTLEGKITAYLEADSG